MHFDYVVFVCFCVFLSEIMCVILCVFEGVSGFVGCSLSVVLFTFLLAPLFVCFYGGSFVLTTCPL